MTLEIQRSPSNKLVNDAWRLVFSHLKDPNELRNITRVCKLFNDIIKKDSWKEHCYRVFTANLLPESTDWKDLAFHYLFWALKYGCFITQYSENQLGIKLNLYALGMAQNSKREKFSEDRVKEIFLLVYPTKCFKPVEIAKALTNRNYQNKIIRGFTSSEVYSTLIFFKEDTMSVLAAFFNAARNQKLFNNPLRDLIIRFEARDSKPSIACSMAAEVAELRRVSCVTPPVP